MAEFKPQDLDRLEDALDGLEDVDDLSTLGLEAPLRERLESYQLLLRASRDALPMEDVSDGVLDGVLAEARETAVVEPERPGLWQRWRRAFIPIFALAGTTAAVLWIVRPNGDAMEGGPSAEMPSLESKPSSGAAARAAVEEVSEEEAPGRAKEDPNAAPTAEAEPPPTPAEARQEAADTKSPASKAAYEQKKRDGLEDAAPEPAEKLTDKDEVWQTIEDADRQRRLGNCDAAEPLYRRAENSATNTKARAAAWMGLGLCEEAGGVESSKYLRDAEAADPSIAEKIESERGSGRSATKKAKPAPKKKSKAAPDQAMQNNQMPRD